MHKTPWPTKAVMEQIYEQKLWGGKEFDFFSGFGSYEMEIVNPYLDAVILFLKSFEKPLILCDLGCGDFNIGKQLACHTKEYYAIDIAENVITRNKKIFKESNVQFLCLDIASDDLPSGDCAIVRQVLQHLSNAEISIIIKKLYAFKYVILTEHVPKDSFLPNIDIISGQGIRLKKNSGINVLASPFNLGVKKEELLSTVFLEGYKGRIVTTLYTIF